MNRHRIAPAAVLASAFLVGAVLAGCAQTTSAGAVVTVDASKSGAPVALAPGERLDVRLDGNPTTGFLWSLADGPSDVLAAVGEPAFEQAPHDSGAVGVGGRYVFTFKAVAPGTRTLTLTYARPWEKGTPPAQTVTYPVTVR